LILAGKVADDNYKKKLNEYIQKNKLEKNILFTGNLNREELRDLYKSANVGLFPVGKQGGWLAPFEMLCSEKPVIVSEEMGAASIIKGNGLGIVTKEYSNALIEVYKNPKNYRKRAEIASSFVKKNLSWNIFS